MLCSRSELSEPTSLSLGNNPWAELGVAHRFNTSSFLATCSLLAGSGAGKRRTYI